MLGRDPHIPPRRLLRYGREEFAESGERHVGLLLDLAGLRSEHRVLELGCGPGRLARVLVPYLTAGAYHGIDLDGRAVGWCRRAYRRQPNARFVRADVFHPRLHPGGAHTAAEYRLPYDDASVDLVVAFSVFSHLLEADAANYLAEARRVLEPRGRLLATFFVLDDASRAAIADAAAAMPFLDAGEHVAVVSEDLPEEAVAYDRDWIAAQVGGGLDVHPGGWRGIEDAPDLLDVVVARRA